MELRWADPVLQSRNQTSLTSLICSAVSRRQIFICGIHRNRPSRSTFFIIFIFILDAVERGGCVDYQQRFLWSESQKRAAERVSKRETKMSGVTNQEEEKKPADQGAHINLKVKGQSVDLNSIAFLFDGRRLRAEQTPDELEMEDGDEIDAMLHQTGGASA
ncbi:Small ubiquitin-related modifier 1 [Linum perenne]